MILVDLPQLLIITGKMNSSGSPWGNNFNHNFGLGWGGMRFLLATFKKVYFEFVFSIFLSLNAFFLVNSCLKLQLDFELHRAGMLDSEDAEEVWFSACEGAAVALVLIYIPLLSPLRFNQICATLQLLVLAAALPCCCLTPQSAAGGEKWAFLGQLLELILG